MKETKIVWLLVKYPDTLYTPIRVYSNQKDAEKAAKAQSEKHIVFPLPFIE